MNDDALKRLEELAALHTKGDLTDDEFATAKARVLNAPDDPVPRPAPDPAPTVAAISRAMPAAAAVRIGGSGLARKVRHDHEKGVWRQWWVLVVAGFLGFMYMTVGTAVAPGSALWTGRLICGSGFHMISNSSSYSYGTTSGTSISFACVHGSSVQSASTPAIWGLQWLLGIAVSYILILLLAAFVRLRST